MAMSEMEFEKLLNKALSKHQEVLDSIIEDATWEIESAFDRGWSIDDLRYVIEDNIRLASQEANSYYNTLRQLMIEAGENLDDMPVTELLDPDRALWQVMGGFNDTDFMGLTYGQVKAGQSRAGMSMEDLWGKLPWNNIDDLQASLADLMRASDRLTTDRNMRIDPAQPRWARVPTGFETCAFCAMLAGRGFEYRSAESAGLENSYHSRCDCQIVPEWNGHSMPVQDYHPEQYAKMWDKAVKATKSKDYRERLKTMRKQNPTKLKDGTQNQAIHERLWNESKDVLSMRKESKGSFKSWQKRQILAGVPVDVDRLYYHETVFLEKFKEIGQQFEWIPKSDSGDATNDFRWITHPNGETLAELKSVKTLKYKSTALRISDAVERAKNHGVVKDTFIIDYGDAKLPDKLIYQLSQYNKRHPQGNIKELWIWDFNGFQQIKFQ
ncbi:VG15 protein [Alloscardovia sp. HMSC034E08]|uniref:VG15 protein n=1 Tax=Alloscardovia sp. HMSC034E08 TaxID=1739413 RepID=UPI001FEF1767|nr:hypothetical protein [Alloscardovia sp. HMSC034E08]